MSEKLELIGKKFTFELLNSIAREPLRFKELEKIIKNDKTRSERLGELTALGLIEQIAIKKDRTYLAYKLTSKGEKVLKHLSAISSVLS